MDERTRSGVRWDDLSAFLAVARTGGLSAAARETGASAPTLGRRMRALERALGRELFVRRTHGYDLTDAGRAMVHELEGVAGRIERITARPAGDALPLVKLSAGTWTTLVLVRRSLELAGDPPDLRIRFLAAEDILSIGRREAAIGIRNRRPTEGGARGPQARPRPLRSLRRAGRPAGLDTGIRRHALGTLGRRARGRRHPARSQPPAPCARPRARRCRARGSAVIHRGGGAAPDPRWRAH